MLMVSSSLRCGRLNLKYFMDENMYYNGTAPTILSRGSSDLYRVIIKSLDFLWDIDITASG